MGSTPISTPFLTASLLAVVLLELAAAAAGSRFQLPRLWLIAAARSSQMLAVMALAMVQAGGLHVLGLDRNSLLPGLRKGLIWSAGFAAAAGLLFLGLLMTGQNPLTLIRSPLPEGAANQLLFFFVGGIVAPVAEEMVFRGVIFGYLRRWGLPAAVLVSTALFAALHLPAVPVTQIVGGMVFAVAYHTGKSLMVPIVIHVLGNLAIFSLSLPWIK
jgi:membrane protease YdiL (CAAX protease family)